ncbi:alanine/glycine:cation symporter family protein [Clostridium sp. 29_15]|uniref:alanine/glycine:cation symporter family protein n=1 Tax=Clostridium sp. 29_15 TaxID=1896982 RepID=UPI00095E4FC6|nr:sodium:alanine symporter family protein [Clostridium sp. 29_15]OKZ85408.1 MAG: sodium:alanine symporter family protein [Clostridium sp. 29_15]
MKFLEIVKNILNLMNNLVWGPPLLILLVGTGIYFTVKLGFLQITKLPLAFKYLFSKDEDQVKGDGDISSFAALCTALSATIGTGNIVGVATAVGTGGPGAILWMWLAAFVGMATKYAEGFLAIKYRECDENGQMCGGPMYYIEKGTGNKLLAKLFAFFGLAVALLGIGTFGQVKSISDAVTKGFNIPPQITATVITVLVAAVTLGGIQRISKVAEKIVPFMASLYIIGALLILICYFKEIPEAILLIVSSAFNPQAALGGAAGITIKTVIQRGIGRGIFSNEAGLGSAPIAAAAAKTKSPVKQGLISMIGTFIDTILICTMTGLALVLTGAFNSGLEGVAMTTAAFETAFPIAGIGKFIVNIGLIFFAFTTIIGWNYYGEKCLQYLAGIKSIKLYKIVFISFVAVGPFLSLDTVFVIADIVNGLMALPNLVGLIALRKVVISETEEFFAKEELKIEKV